MESYKASKDIKKFNYENRDKTKTCPDCKSNNLQPQYYGYSCLDCGALLTYDLKPANIDDLI